MKKKTYQEVVSMHERRKSDESIEITAYLLKHRKVDEECIDDLCEQIRFIETELSKRSYDIKHHKAKENINDRFVKEERDRLKNVVNAIRDEIIKNSSKGKAC